MSLSDLDVSLSTTWACFLEVVKSGDVYLIDEFLKSEPVHIQEILLTSPLNGDSHAIHFLSEFGFHDLLHSMVSKYKLDGEVPTAKSGLTCHDIATANDLT